MITLYEYDTNGNQTCTKMYSLNSMSLLARNECEKDAYGKITKEYDPRYASPFNNGSFYTEYSYDAKCGMRIGEIAPNNQAYNYEYDSNKRQTALTATNINNSTTNIANRLTYTNDRVSKITHNGVEYEFEYDPFGRTSEIKIAGSTLLSLAYVDSTSSSVTSNYGNGNTVEVISDARGNPTSKIINDTIVSVAEYDAHGHISKLLDNRKNVCYNYTYDEYGNLTTVDETSGSTLINRLSYSYDSENRLISRYDSATWFTYKTLYEKKSPSLDKYIYPDETVRGIELEDRYVDSVEYGYAREIDKRKLTFAAETDPFITEEYDYVYGEKWNLTSLISEVNQTVGNNFYTTQYTYDEMGNIASYTIGGNTVSYGYDTLGRLTRETNGITGYTTFYSYDNGGNITSKQVYNAGDILCETYTYTYDTVWKDKLLSITKTDVATNTTTTETITYDDNVNILGNPKTYRGNNLTWTDVRRLSSYGSNTFSYGADGIRYRKNNITYTLDGSRILKESGARNITYYYGLSGVIGFNYGGMEYYYRKNIQGDVIAIHNASGTLVASYAYDAWGKCTILAGNDSVDSIANINPFRYRSYYYDTETGLYYLETRYYDPEIGRFISADSIEYLDPETIGGLNLFAYCNNNPVMYADPTGHSIITALIIGAILGAVIGFGATALKDYTNDKKIFNGDVSFGTYLGHTLGGGIAGLGTGACSFLGVAVGYAALTGTTFTLCGIAMTEGLALATGATFAFFTGGVGYTIRVALDEQETFELSDMFIESFANACSGVCSFFAGYDSAIYGWKTPAGNTSLKNHAMSFGVSVAFGYLPMKGIIALLKSVFKEYY